MVNTEISTKFTIVVERRSGTMPNIVWHKAFEREMDSETMRISLTDLISALHELFFGVDYRIVLYA